MELKTSKTLLEVLQVVALKKNWRIQIEKCYFSWRRLCTVALIIDVNFKNRKYIILHSAFLDLASMRSGSHLCFPTYSKKTVKVILLPTVNFPSGSRLPKVRPWEDIARETGAVSAFSVRKKEHKGIEDRRIPKARKVLELGSLWVTSEMGLQDKQEFWSQVCDGGSEPPELKTPIDLDDENTNNVHESLRKKTPSPIPQFCLVFLIFPWLSEGLLIFSYLKQWCYYYLIIIKITNKSTE